MSRILAFLAALVSNPLVAATLPATPATFQATLFGAAAGDVVKLGPGTYARLSMAGKVARLWSAKNPVVIDGSDPAAVLEGLTIGNSSGVKIVNVTLHGGSIGIIDSHDVTVKGFLCVGATRNCVGVSRSQNVSVSFGEIIDAGSDGVDVAGSQHVDVSNIACYGSKPTPGAHPDCVQVYSKPPYVPLALSYVSVRDSVAVGDTQGFVMFGNAVTADHVVFSGLTVMGRYPRGISMSNCTPGCESHGNRVIVMRGAPHWVQIDPLTPPPGWAADSVTDNSPATARP